MARGKGIVIKPVGTQNPPAKRKRNRDKADKDANITRGRIEDMLLAKELGISVDELS